MNHIDKINARFSGFYFPNDFKFMFIDNTVNIFFNAGDIISIKSIINSGWDKQDFIDAIDVWKRFSYHGRTFENLYDLETNLDKYLNEATIISIIK